MAHKRSVRFSQAQTKSHLKLQTVLLRGNRTLGNISRLYLYSRHKSSMSRCLSESVFPGFIIQKHLYNRLLAEALGIPGAKRRAYIIIDTTANRKRSGKMDNRIIYKKGYTSTDIEQTSTRRNLIYLAYFLPEELKDLAPEFRDALYNTPNLSLDI